MKNDTEVHIVVAVLNGTSYEDVSDHYGVSIHEVRKMIVRHCKEINPELFQKSLRRRPKTSLLNIRYLRKHRMGFIDNFVAEGLFNPKNIKLWQ